MRLFTFAIADLQYVFFGGPDPVLGENLEGQGKMIASGVTEPEMFPLAHCSAFRVESAGVLREGFREAIVCPRRCGRKGN
jgi:hypothetical protein